MVALFALPSAACNAILGLDPVDAPADGAPDGGPVPPGALAQVGYVKANEPDEDAGFGGGLALAADGMTLAVGAPSANAQRGAVYLYVREANQWAYRATVAVPPGFADDADRFGSAVALAADGTLLAVGAPGESSGGNPGYSAGAGAADNGAVESGAVYLFERSGDIWSPLGMVKASDAPAAGAQFGSALALASGGTALAVGAYRAAAGKGRVYHFVRGTTPVNLWAGRAELPPENAVGSGPASTLRFGYAVALAPDGTTLVASAPSEQCFKQPGASDCGTLGALDAGAVYVYDSLAVGTWAAPRRLVAPNRDANDAFGEALALADDGQTLVVGAAAEAGGGVGVGADPARNDAQKSGAVYVFTRGAPPAEPWTAPPMYLKAGNAAEGFSFGHAVALSGAGDVLAVGSHTESGGATGVDGDDTAAPKHHSGAVYLFARAQGVWAERAYVKASNADPNDMFGKAVALAPDGAAMAIGAPAEDSDAVGVDGDQANNRLAQSGAAYMFWMQAP